MGLEFENILCKEALEEFHLLKRDSTTWDDIKLWAKKHLELHFKTSFKYSEKLRLPITINDDEDDLKDYEFINEFTRTMELLKEIAKYKRKEKECQEAIKVYCRSLN